MLAIPRWGCLNGHASLLPRWRGAAPIQRAIEAGDQETGVSAMLMEAGLDTGPIVATRNTPIAPDDTAGSLHDRLANMTAACLGTVIDNLPDSLATPIPQAEDGIIYAAKISPADAEIDWQKPAKWLDYHIRAFSPVPERGASGRTGRLRLSAGHPAPIPDGTPNLPAGCFLGKSAEGAMLIRCGDAAFAVTKVQPAGKKPMSADAFLNGCNLVVGAPLARLSDRRSDETAGSITIEYDGGPFVGWQRQDNGLSVQGAIEGAAAAFVNSPVAVSGAGRTDAGVHATGQAAHLDVPVRFSANRVQEALNAHLANLPITICTAQDVAANFHARFDAIGRRYLYRILPQRQRPALDRGRVWHHKLPLDAERMADAAQYLLGRHDFTSFRATQCQANSAGPNIGPA